MTIVTGTFQTGSSVRNREDFTNLISRITPEETPFFSLLDGEKVEGVKHEWQTETIRTPVLTNAQVEGDQYAYTSIVATSRVGNYTQISREGFAVSKTQEVVSKAGPKSELGKERVRAGLALRHDIEASMLSNNASVAGLTRKSGGLRAWLTSNDTFGSGGASGGYNSGTGVVDAATASSALRAFTKSELDSTIQATYQSGGNPTIIMLSPWNKRVFSGFMADASVAQLRMASKPSEQATIVGAADAYLSDFGLMSVVPNRQMSRTSATAASYVYLIDTDKVAKGFLRDIQEDKNIALNADADAKMLICEWTLVVKNQAAHGVVADVYGLTAST
jgi:hypothetical protein